MYVGPLRRTVNFGRVWPLHRGHAPSRAAVVFRERTYTYGDLQVASEGIGKALGKISRERVGLIMRPSLAFAAAVGGVWERGGVVVPMHVGGWEKIGRDAGIKCVIFGEGTGGTGEEDLEGWEGLRIMKVDEHAKVSASSGKGEQTEVMEMGDDELAMLLYTSGTTGSPKGVEWSFGMLRYQMEVLSRTWRWDENDWIVNVLPLNHVHGLVNVLLCALYNGAKVEMMESFDADHMWKRIDSGEITVVMGVPTMYRRLIKRWDEGGVGKRGGIKNVRLFVCGSAYLDDRTFERWEEISGKKILQRYGMTEVGMALSNKYDERIKGTVGVPLYGVEVKVSEENELRLKGPGVFRRYWNLPEETRKAFDRDGWFKTGDVVSRDERGLFSIVGRFDTDIIKSGGYKISAPEIERELLCHSGVEESAIVGLQDDDLGQRVVAMVVRSSKGKDSDRGLVTEEDLKTWLKQRIPKYKVPRTITFTSSLPKNALGKVQKKLVVKSFDEGQTAAFGSSTSE